MSNGVKRSYTALRQFENCERQFFYQRILGLPEAPSIHLSLGILYHECLDLMCRAGAVAKEQLLPLLEKAKASRLWVDPGKPDEELIDEIWTAMGKVNRGVFQKGLRVRKSEVWGTTYCAKIDVLADNTPVVEDGRILEFKDEPCIIDWKTKSSDKKRSQFSVDLNMQLALYCIDFGVKNGAIIEVPRHAADEINVILTSFDEYDLARWKRYLDAQFEVMSGRGTGEQEYKLASRGFPLCSPRWCSYWDRCPGGAR